MLQQEVQPWIRQLHPAADLTEPDTSKSPTPTDATGCDEADTLKVSVGED